MAIVTIPRRGIVPLSDANLAQLAPSIFAPQPWEGVSDKYTFIPTAKLITRLRDEGFLPIDATQSRVTRADKQGYQLHSVRLVHRSALDRGLLVDQTFPTVSITNAHDTNAAFAIDAGLYRLVCGNGMMVPDSIVHAVKVRHTGDLNDVIEGVFSVVEEAAALPELIERYRAVPLLPEQQHAFAAAAKELRNTALDICPKALLRPVRHEDLSADDYDLPKPDLWTTVNVVQEHLIKGGVQGTNSNGRRMRVRPIKDIAEDNRINKALFVLAEELRRTLQ